MPVHFNEHGKTVLTGEDAIKGWLAAVSARRLSENRKLHYKMAFQDIPISVENRKGTIRSGKSEDGEEWETKMKVPYGYIPGTEGVDGDELDVFVGPEENAAYAYIVHCNTPDGKEFDEDKIMLGFKSKEQAERCFRQHYDDDCFFGGIDEIPMWKFRTRAFIKKETTDGPMKESEGASMQVPEEYFNGEAGRGTDQDMKKSILGRNIMPSPGVRESQEHGVKGMQWGVRKPDLEHDPRTLSMMHVIRRSQPQLNAIKVWQKNRAARLAQQGQHPPSTQQHHAEALEALKHIGWHVLGETAKLTGLGGVVDGVKTILGHTSGTRATLRTNTKGNHSMKLDSGRRRTRTSAIESFMESKSGTYYARSLDHYGTDAEESDMDLIREAFGGSVNSPKTKRHAELGMGYFHKKVDAAKRVVIKPAHKRRVTAGVFSEAVHALKKKKPVYAIYKGKMRRVQSVEALDNPNNEGHFGQLVFKKRKEHG